jgi:glycosyltransferase involved in cell wall biosynthesis
VPAFDAARTLAGVLQGLADAAPETEVIVVDDGSRDGTSTIARARRATVLPSRSRRSHAVQNHGKGAALQTGLVAAHERGYDVVVTVDADGQHRAEDAVRIARSSAPAGALVLGVRDLARAGAPRANRISNGISNYFLSRFAGRELPDTQCGLRRYPVAQTLALGVRGERYDFEAEVILRAAWAGIPIAFEPIDVLYPVDRETHFDVREDPWRILGNVLTRVAEHRFHRFLRRHRAP